MIPALARIKRALREAISSCGGVDGAGATAGRSRSVAGDWHNLNKSIFPPLDCAFAIDEVCLAEGQRAPILSAYAAELGHVCTPVGEVKVLAGGLNSALVDASAEFGDIAGAVRDATRDHRVCARDRSDITVQIDQAMASLARLRFVVNAMPEDE